jgi:hypothetical protein
MLLVAVVITLVMFVISMPVVGPTTVVIRSVIWITPVIAAWVIAITRISVVAIPVCGVTDSDWANSNRNLSISLFHWNQSQPDCYQWK